MTAPPDFYTDKGIIYIMKVLFIGNSYTYYNDMPALFKKECEKNGVTAEVTSVTAGGYRLRQFLSDDDEYALKRKRLLGSETYDYIVLQEHSTVPLIDPGAFLECVSEFTEMIKANGAKPVLYQTWGRADNSKTLSDLKMTHDEMQNGLRAIYKTAANENGALPVYAGDAFDKAYKEGVDVYDPDGSHPSLSGSKIIAKEFCRSLISAL